MVDLQTLAQNLAASISQSQDSKITAANTATINKVKSEVIQNTIKESLDVDDMSGLTTDKELTAALATYVKKSDIFSNSGYLYSKTVDTNGSYSLIFGESDGGGVQFYNQSADILSYIGTNNGDANGITIQLYSKFRDGTVEGTTQNSGVRINVNPNGAYYTKGTDTSATGGSTSNEIAVKGDIEALGQLISELSQRVTALENKS